MAANNDKPLSVSEAAERLGVSSATIVRWANDGKIRTLRTLGNHRRVLSSEVDAILASASGGSE